MPVRLHLQGAAEVCCCALEGQLARRSCAPPVQHASSGGAGRGPMGRPERAACAPSLRRHTASVGADAARCIKNLAPIPIPIPNPMLPFPAFLHGPCLARPLRGLAVIAGLLAGAFLGTSLLAH